MTTPWSDLMLDTIQWEVAAAERDAHGQVASYAAPVSVRCRVVNKTRMARNAQGQEVVSTTTVYIDGAPGIAPADRVTLPDGSTPPIIAVQSFPDDTGNRYEAVLT